MTHIRCTLGRTLAAVLVAAALAGPARPDDALRLGVLPYAAPTMVQSGMEPTRSALTRGLGRPVDLVVPSGYLALLREAVAGGFDLALVPPHHADLLAGDLGWSFVASASRPAAPTIYVWADSGIERVEDLRGRRIAVVAPGSIVRDLGEAELRKRGIRLGLDATLVESATHGGAIFALLSQQADAVVTLPIFAGMVAPRIAQELRVLYQGERFPSAMVMARPGLDRATVGKAREILLAIPPEGGLQPEEGPPYHPVSSGTIESLARYRTHVRELAREHGIGIGAPAPAADVPAAVAD